MKAIDLIRWAMRMSDEGTANIVADMRDAPLTQPTSRGGNGSAAPPHASATAPASEAATGQPHAIASSGG